MLALGVDVLDSVRILKALDPAWTSLLLQGFMGFPRLL